METNSVEYVFDVVSTQLPKAGVEFLMIGGHPENPHRVDFLKIDQDSMDELLKSAENIDYCGYKIKVPGISDLIAMKLFAAAHGSWKREEKDLLDVINLADECNLDFEMLRDLCNRYANDEIYSKIETRMGGEGADD